MVYNRGHRRSATAAMRDENMISLVYRIRAWKILSQIDELDYADLPKVTRVLASQGVLNAYLVRLERLTTSQEHRFNDYFAFRALPKCSVVIDWLCKAATHSDYNMCLNAIERLGEFINIYDDHAVDVLLHATSYRNGRIRQEAVNALGKVVGPCGYASLIDDAPGSKAEAIGNRVATLLRADPYPAARAACPKVLASVFGSASIPVLRQYAQSKDTPLVVRKQCAYYGMILGDLDSTKTYELLTSEDALSNQPRCPTCYKTVNECRC